MRISKSFIFLFALLAAGCNSQPQPAPQPDPPLIETAVEIARLAQDPNNILALYGTILVVVAVILIWIDEQGVWKSLLNSVRYTGLMCVAAGPLVYLTQRDIGFAGAITTAGLLGLMVTTLAFWKDLYPKR